MSRDRGTAMWRFRKNERKEVWEEEIPGPLGDIEAAQRIRAICRSALDSAAKVGSFAGPADDKKNKREFERYERAARAAMEIAMKITDDLLRDSAVRQIVGLCMKANDLKTAKILFRAIQAVSIREDVMVEYPGLRE